MGLLAYRTYSAEAPIPARVVGPGRVLFTREDILSGQQVFLRNGLMEYGSIFGHGAFQRSQIGESLYTVPTRIPWPGSRQAPFCPWWSRL
jgi:nitric oxide reductase large subunit